MNNNIIKIITPLKEEMVLKLKAGDRVYISGTIYTARDAAHQRLINSIKKQEKLPFDVKNQIIYYVGPSPAKPGNVIGSAGPTTSYRMDDLTIPLLNLGLSGMIGKGTRSKEVVESMKSRAVYFAAIGGAGALISSKIIKSEVIAYEELGPEAIRKLEVKDLPLYVVIDSHGNNLYDSERKKYKK
ncbi:Fe-S-containing hydro-lyase [Helicovermis profundi]|uniref:Fe-S-containing hydro-lyase n=1 Tax=Helicovermis profundi TaxID=3065157 RepID=A0AAU9EYM8_9FIRM|nr:Fe-S-containing hydro-lyase [Clostridia bacterium S502]